MNFLFGVPQWCVSVAVHDDDGGIAGVVFDPLRDEIFCGERGGAATLNGAPIAARRARTSRPRSSRRASPTRRRCARAQAAVVARVLPVVRDVRRMGSAALDLAWTAAGRYDAFYERGVQAWDIAAGVAALRVLGARRARRWRRDGAAPGGVIVAPPGSFDELHALVS